MSRTDNLTQHSLAIDRTTDLNSRTTYPHAAINNGPEYPHRLAPSPSPHCH